MLISVIMPVYNGSKYVRKAIQSIFDQTINGVELIIVNDASTDNTAQIAAEMVEIAEDYSVEVLVLKNHVNMGLTKSLNIALKHTNGVYIARQDADDISMPRRFEEQLKLFQGDVEMVSTHGISISATGQRIRDWYTDEAQRRPKEEILRAATKDWWVLGPSMMYTKAIVDKVGGYNEKCVFAQDYNLWWRMLKYCGFGIVRKEMYKYRRHAGSVRHKRKDKSINWLKIALENV